MSLIKTKYETTKIYDAPVKEEITSVQDIFPIEAIDESGIFALPGGKYSKTYMLSDINFAGVTDEEQKAIIVSFSKVLKGIPCRFSYSIANEHVDEGGFNERILYRKHGDEDDRLRDCFNRIIGDKISDAKQGLYQSIYLTLTVKAEDMKDAKAAYMSIEGAIRSAFVGLGLSGMQGSSMKTLTIDERMQLIYNFTHTGLNSGYKFKYQDAIAAGADFLNIISPAAVEFDNDYFVLNESYGMVMYIDKYPKEYDKKLDETKSRLDNAETDKEKEELKEQIEALEEAKSQNSGLLSESKEKMEHGNRLDFTEYLQQAEGTELLNDPERAMEMAQSCGMVREVKVDECLKPVRDKALIPESGTLLYSQKAGEGQMLTIKRNFELDDKGLVYSLYEISDPISGRALKTVSDKGVSGDAWDKMLNEILADAGMLRDQPLTVHKSEDDLKEYVRISDKNFTTAREEGGQDISEEAKAVIEEARKDAQQRQGYMRSFYKTLEVPTERVMSDEERKLSLELDGGLVEGITLIGMDDEKARVSICSDAEYKYKSADGRTRTISGEDIMKSLEGKGREQSPERSAAKPAKRG